LTRRVHLPALLSSVAVVAIGLVLLLDELGSFTLSLGAFAPIALAVVGMILIAGGLASEDGGS
jgi:hypothetical protein